MSHIHFSRLTEEQISVIAEALLIAIHEAKGEYFYDTILVKRSLTGDSNSGPCEVCDENEAEGWIDSEDVYPSGDDGPPFHPNCVCSEEYKEKRVRVYV
jgi:hypothetical protein